MRARARARPLPRKAGRRASRSFRVAARGAAMAALAVSSATAPSDPFAGSFRSMISAPNRRATSASAASATLASMRVIASAPCAGSRWRQRKYRQATFQKLAHPIAPPSGARRSGFVARIPAARAAAPQARAPIGIHRNRKDDRRQRPGQVTRPLRDAKARSAAPKRVRQDRVRGDLNELEHPSRYRSLCRHGSDGVSFC